MPIFKTISAILLSICFISVYAQSVPGASVSGKVIESKTRLPLESAVIKLLHARDSTLSAGVFANKTGEFSIGNQLPGNYLVKISFIGFKIIIKPLVISQEHKSVNIGTIELEEGINLNEVIILGEPSPVAIKGDTTEFNGNSFKTTQDAMVEDLIKKLPGMEVDRSGNITTNGESVLKITVEGRDFFGNDPKMATRNLPADAIAKVQIIEEKTEEAKAKGIDDGIRIKTMNLILKSDKKSGWFGNTSLVGGTDSRYHGSLSANHFDKDKQLNFLVLSNNISQGFSSEDATNFAGSNAAMSVVAGNGGNISTSIGGVNIGNSPGRSKTNSAGINFSDAWGKNKNVKFSGSYNASLSSAETERLTHTQKIQPTETFFNNSTNIGDNTNQSHRFNARITARIDSLTNLTFIPSLSLGSGSSNNAYNSFENNSGGQKINSVARNSHTDNITPSFNGTLSLSRQFKQRKGSNSLYISSYSSGTSSDFINQSVNTYFQRSLTQTFDRLESSDNASDYFNISNTITKTISKNKRTNLHLTAGLIVSSNDNDRNTLAYDPISGNYELAVDSLSNNLRGKTFRYSSGLGINKRTAKWNVNATANLQKTVLKADIRNNTRTDSVTKDYLRILPQASFSYRPKTTTTYTFNTSASLNPPSFNNLLQIQNNTSPLNLYEGNPDLKPTTNYNSTFNYRFFDPRKNRLRTMSLTFFKPFDAQSRSMLFDSQTGITHYKPVNVNGNFRLTLNGSFGVPTKVKDLRISPGISMFSSRDVSLTNGQKNQTERFNGGLTLNVSYALKETVNFTFNSRNSYERAHNSVQSARNTNYFNLTNNLTLNFEPVKMWRITADVVQQSYANRSVVLFTPGIKKFFTEKRNLSMELSGFDVLDQNSDITRTISANYISDIRSNNITRYFYMKLAYKVNKLGGTTNRTQVGPSK